MIPIFPSVQSHRCVLLFNKRTYSTSKHLLNLFSSTERHAQVLFSAGNESRHRGTLDFDLSEKFPWKQYGVRDSSDPFPSSTAFHNMCGKFYLQRFYGACGDKFLSNEFIVGAEQGIKSVAKAISEFKYPRLQHMLTSDFYTEIAPTLNRIKTDKSKITIDICEIKEPPGIFFNSISIILGNPIGRDREEFLGFSCDRDTLKELNQSNKSVREAIPYINEKAGDEWRVRIDMKFQSKDVFCIESQDGNILLGSPYPQDVIHNVQFEASLPNMDMSTAYNHNEEYEMEWQISDIDSFRKNQWGRE